MVTPALAVELPVGRLHRPSDRIAAAPKQMPEMTAAICWANVVHGAGRPGPVGGNAQPEMGFSRAETSTALGLSRYDLT